MKTSDFAYELPKELIAQDPLADRSASRLMVLNKETGETTERVFSDIVEYLTPGDCLVLNNTRVIPARLLGARIKPEAEKTVPGQEGQTGGKVELLLLKRLSDTTWETLVKPGKRCRAGSRISFGDGLLTAEIIEVKEDGNRIVRFFYDGIFEEILDQLGQMPLPPYITHTLKDKNRYQTVYAKYDGSAAAPTAGLHFTPQLLEAIRKKGVSIAEITLHVGLGTFRPVKVEDVTQHQMHSEYCVITEEAADAINRARQSGHKVICVGTTSCRTLESMVNEDGTVRAGSLWTDIFIYPGYHFKATDALITNFHLPESTLLMLVSALAGKEHILAAYERAVRDRFRFFSFGDVMYIS